MVRTSPSYEGTVAAIIVARGMTPALLSLIHISQTSSSSAMFVLPALHRYPPVRSSSLKTSQKERFFFPPAELEISAIPLPNWLRIKNAGNRCKTMIGSGSYMMTASHPRTASKNN